MMTRRNDPDSSASNGVNAKAGREIKITRLLHAARALVFKVWTDPKHVAKWLGDPDGVDYPNVIVFHEVIEPELFTYSHSCCL